jgi:prepilin-type N-terminal cleavage/methylation domain-containing protein
MFGLINGNKGSRGFTLIETMVVVFILGVVTVGLMQVLVTSRNSYEQQKVTLEMQQNARVGIEALADDFRHVSFGKDPTQPSILYAGPDSVMFVADIIPDIPGAEMITYSLSDVGDTDTPNPTDTILMKTVVDSGGTVLFIEPQAYGIKNGGLSFRYFNGAGTELANPVPSPELIGEALISVTAVEPRQYKNSGTYLEETLTITIYPRNLPLTPSRSRPSMPALGALTAPDCQSVTIPWTTPTTNTDGTELEFGHISHFTIYFGTHSDSLSLYSRVARTINEWTVTSLESNQQYFFSVTCTSRSGVESHMSQATFNLSNSFYPEIVSGIGATPNAGGPGVILNWNYVSLYTNGETITTPISYNVYRSINMGEGADPANLLAMVPSWNSYVDSTLTPCTGYYYCITATACSNEGTPSTELLAAEPAPPECIEYIDAMLTAYAGEVQLHWGVPMHRTDGSTFEIGDYTGARVYYSLTPYTYNTYVDVTGGAMDCLLTGLATCQTYYINIACFDQCPTLGDICYSEEISINTAEPCDPDIPVAIASVRGVGLDGRIDITWAANTTDCDLKGYYLYYGGSAGGPYTGVDAVEGTSPITYLVDDVTGVDDSCRVSLTGLGTCQNYSVVIKGYDGCDPPNVSTVSPEASPQTECSPCAVDAACVSYLAQNPSYDAVHLEIFPTDGQAETITSLIPRWSGPSLVTEVWAGRPLVEVWNADGSAGEDGAVGGQTTESELDVTDFDLSGAAVDQDGMPVKLVFDTPMIGQDMTVDIRGNAGGVCSGNERSVHQGFAFDNFDDGNMAGWTTSNGSWSVVDGEMYQSTTLNVCKALLPGSYTNLIYEAKVKIDTGYMPYLLFRVQDDNNYYMFGLKTSTGKVRLAKYAGGSFSEIANADATISAGNWYQLRVEVEGTNVKAYLDCDLILNVNDTSMYPSGQIGFRTYQTKAYFDDIRAFASIGS